MGLAKPASASTDRRARPRTMPDGSTPRPAQNPANVLELLHPGSFVKLQRHPADLPPFQLIRCQGGRCWVRQQSWGPAVHWEVPHRQLKSLGA